MKKKFGEYFKELRIKKGLTLRKYCEKYDLDAAQISRMERDLLAAPKVKEKIKFYAETLGLKEGSSEWNEFFELASISNGSFGVEDVKNPALLNKLPIFLRTLDNKNLSEEKLDKLLELIRKS